MKVNIIVFSQTGNTQKVAEVMAEEMQQHESVDVRLIPFKELSMNDFQNADLFAVGSPCFESQAPTPVRQFLAKIPSMTGKDVFVFSTSGGAPGRVLRDLAKPLEKKGANVLGAFICKGTNHHPLPCINGQSPCRPNHNDLEKAKSFAGSLIEDIQNGALITTKEARNDLLKPGLKLYSVAGLLLKEPLLRLLLPKPKTHDGRCNQCQWCVHECPTQSITVRSEPEIKSTCIRCYRCMNGCPQQAYSVKWGISNFVVWSLYNETFARTFGNLKDND